MDVKTLCLGVLTLGDASGYEIKKQFEDGPFSYFYDAGYGSIYPALGKLLAEGLVDCTETAQERRPAKKVYAITAAGEAAFRKALHKRPARDRIRSEYMVMFFFAQLLDEDHLRSVFEEYLAQFRYAAEHVRGLDSTGIPPGRLFARGFGRTFFETAARYMEENRHLLFDGGSEGEEGADTEPMTGTGR
jgi:DNA-binding PadR family transcriptional regulator